MRWRRTRNAETSGEPPSRSELDHAYFVVETGFGSANRRAFALAEERGDDNGVQAQLAITEFRRSRVLTFEALNVHYLGDAHAAEVAAEFGRALSREEARRFAAVAKDTPPIDPGPYYAEARSFAQQALAEELGLPSSQTNATDSLDPAVLDLLIQTFFQIEWGMLEVQLWQDTRKYAVSCGWIWKQWLDWQADPKRERGEQASG